MSDAHTLYVMSDEHILIGVVLKLVFFVTYDT